MQDIYYQNIYDYLNDTMPVAERTAFEQQLQTDEELQQAVDFHRELIQGIHFLGDEALRQSIQETHQAAGTKGLLLTDQHILAYLNGELSAELQQLLETRRASDPDFAREIEWHQNLLEGVNVAGDEELRASIQNTHRKMKTKGILETSKHTTPSASPAKMRSLFNTRNIAIAASFLVLLAVGIYWFLPSSSSTKNLYATYFQINETQLDATIEQLSFRGMAIPDKERRASLQSALVLLQNEQFEQAQNTLRNHLQRFPDDDAAHLYYGITLMQAEAFSSALENFETIDDATSDYQADSKWYQALIYIRLGEETTATSLLRSLTTDSPYAARAEALLEELE